jgi:hypothetical protein
MYIQGEWIRTVLSFRFTANGVFAIVCVRHSVDTAGLLEDVDGMLGVRVTFVLVKDGPALEVAWGTAFRLLSALGRYTVGIL